MTTAEPVWTEAEIVNRRPLHALFFARCRHVCAGDSGAACCLIDWLQEVGVGLGSALVFVATLANPDAGRATGKMPWQKKNAAFSVMRDYLIDLGALESQSEVDE
jgi:hypothetical protein